MNGARSGGYQGESSDDGDDGGRRPVVEVTLAWGEGSAQNVLCVRHVERGTLTLGERGDVLVPEEALGTDRFELVRYDGDEATARVPEGATLLVGGWPASDRTVVLARGRPVEMHLRAFTLRVELTVPGRRPAGAPLTALEESGAGIVVGSALLHAAAFAAVALFTPSLGATEIDPFDVDRMLLVQHLLNASAEREAERTPDLAPSTPGGDVNAGQRSSGREGAAGKPETDKTVGRWAAKGTATPETATLAREHELAAAENFGLLGLLRSATFSDPGAPTAAWGTVANGADDVSKMGVLFGGTIDDAHGNGGLGLLGPDQGGGGTASLIGMNGFSLGHTGSCTGGPCGGIGVSRGGPGGDGHHSHLKAVRYTTPTTNGRLPAEVIQRIVRLNDGRFRLCYEGGLRGNPGLTGRVTVKFMIDRHGAVAFSADGGSDIPDPGVRDCVVRTFASLSFPEPQDGTVTVLYPLVFSPE
jgi:hypothetical protein